MRFEGKTNIRAPRAKVWSYLTNAEKVSRAAPGLEKFEVVDPGKKFRVVTAIGFGSVKARFTSDVEWTELVPPEKAAMKAHGMAPGSAVDADSRMTLADGPDGSTDLNWSADVTISGTIASLAARLMGGVTQKLTSAFFESVRKDIENEK
jgi:carbon monoxide dehydrogenase subunit G